MTNLRFALACLVPFALAACDPGTKSVTASDTLGGSDSGGGTEGETGDSGADSGDGPGTPTTTGAEPGQPRCLEQVTVLAGPDEVSPLGYSAAGIIALSDGWSTNFTWTTDNGGIDVVPEGTTTQLDLGLAYAGGEIRFIDTEPNPDSMDDGNDDGLDPECGDWLEIDMELLFATLDGRFDEQLPIVAIAASGDSMSFAYDVDPDGFSGSFSSAEVTFPDDNGTVDMFSLRGQFAQGQDPSGGLWIEITQWLPGGGPDDAFVGFGIIAGWPTFGK